MGIATVEKRERDGGAVYRVNKNPIGASAHA
jgi:hypothetical protein